MKLIVKMQSDDGKLCTNNPHEMACYDILSNMHQPYPNTVSKALADLWARAMNVYGCDECVVLNDTKDLLELLASDETATIITAVAERREEYRHALALVKRQVDACNAPAPAAVPVSASNVDPVEVFQFSEHDPLNVASQDTPSVAGTKKEQPKGGLDYRK